MVARQVFGIAARLPPTGISDSETDLAELVIPGSLVQDPNHYAMGNTLMGLDTEFRNSGPCPDREKIGVQKWKGFPLKY